MDQNSRRIAGLPESQYGDWKISASAPDTLPKTQIRRLARVLEEERFGGSHLPSFDQDAIECLMTEAKQSVHAQVAGYHHFNAVRATTDAHQATKEGNHAKSAQLHADAVKKHAMAADHLARAGFRDTAMKHHQWAQHHQQHHDYHMARWATSTPKAAKSSGSSGADPAADSNAKGLKRNKILKLAPKAPKALPAGNDKDKKAKAKIRIAPETPKVRVA